MINKKEKANGNHREFHVSRRLRDLIHFDESLFSLSGNVLFHDFRSVREFVHRIRLLGKQSPIPEEALKPGSINAMGLIDEISHYLVRFYEETVNPGAMEKALWFLYDQQGRNEILRLLEAFSREFPPLRVYRDKKKEKAFLAEIRYRPKTAAAVLEELLLLRLANENPAFSPYRELFRDDLLVDHPGYAGMLDTLDEWFEKEPRFPFDPNNLIELLRSPACASPTSLSGQIDYIRKRWGLVLQKFHSRLLISLDLIREDDRRVAAGPPPPPPLPDFSGAEKDAESFSQDRDWMAGLVLIAKSVHVWMDQLSAAYGRNINTLDQIPDSELDRLAGWGITGLWLIGLWERSPASQAIKRLCGNPEALASAYSLHSYRIAGDLGGEEALKNLQQRAMQRGIRLAADMVPNHMGIDSPWVAEHPDWFIQLDHPPFPSYSFSGQDLGGDSNVSVQIEDHYYSRQDAAVVFKWMNRQSGETRFVYHGNDGTSMPWNDTAQLNFLLPQVREAVIRTILDVARKFPVIRFDAAMTLARRHFQRLWYPPPGSGGDIPSRSGRGMTNEEFYRYMPNEFWREVVDRVAAEAPDTLLLAEAFWLMEGYFVRTLGMHRVYNSAFMNYLKNEDNQSFRASIKDVLAFNREILRRYVNFMNNPDEETAAVQFGKGDKYFGVCILMAALPGLPMFGHGQIEGMSEKYGMEYRRGYWSESPDEGFIRRHEEIIFPILRKRYMFAGVERFQLLDFHDYGGGVNEDVIAFFNAGDGERALVIYHNRYAETHGKVFPPCDSLEIPLEDDRFIACRDLVSGNEYIISALQARTDGLDFFLSAYQSLVFMEFWSLNENEWGDCRRLAERTRGYGTPSIAAAISGLALEDTAQAIAGFFQSGYLDMILNFLKRKEEWKRLEEVLFSAIPGWIRRNGRKDENVVLAKEIIARMRPLFDRWRERLAELTKRPVSASWILFILLRNIGEAGAFRPGMRHPSIDELETPLSERLSSVMVSREEARDTIRAAALLEEYQCDPCRRPWTVSSWDERLREMLESPRFRDWLKVNEYQGKTWFSRERWLYWLDLVRLYHGVLGPGNNTRAVDARLEGMTVLAEKAGYDLERFLSMTGKKRKIQE